MKKDYTGTWIPAHVMLDQELHATAKLLYAEIASFNKCFVSNEWLAERLGISVAGIQKNLRLLKSKGYVQTCKFDGRKRTLQALCDEPKLAEEVVKKDIQTLTQVNGRRGLKSMADVDESQYIDNNIDNNIDNSTNVELAIAPKTYGKPEINKLMEDWEAIVGYPITSRIKQNRNAANNLLKKHGYENLQRIMAGVAIAHDEKYAPKIEDFEALQGKFNKLLAWGRDRKANPTNGVVKI